MKRKILFLINDLGGGGAERVLVNLVNNMDQEKYDITVQTIFCAGINKDFLKDHIRLIDGNRKCFKGVSRVIKVLPKSFFNRYLKSIYDENYDVVIAYLQGAATKILWNYKGKKIAWLHSDIRYSPLHSFFFSSQIKECFSTYDRIAGVSNSVCDSFKDKYGLKEKLITVYNTNDVESIISQAQDLENSYLDWLKFNGFKLITLGRLIEAKGYDRLIRVCKLLVNDGFIFKLLILGKGSQESLLNQLIDDNDLIKYVELGGFTPNPYPFIKQADLFLCSSRYEGLSTVMSETIILGTPIITTDVSGAREVLGDSEYGLIVDNSEEGLYKGLRELLSNTEKIDYYKQKAIERAPFFDTKTTVKSVESLIETVINE